MRNIVFSRTYLDPEIFLKGWSFKLLSASTVPASKYSYTMYFIIYKNHIRSIYSISECTAFVKRLLNNILKNDGEVWWLWESPSATGTKRTVIVLFSFFPVVIVWHKSVNMGQRTSSSSKLLHIKHIIWTFLAVNISFLSRM